MGTDTEIETSNPDIEPLAEFDPNKEQAPELDERDVIEPLKKTATQSDDDQQDKESAPTDDEDPGKQEIPLDEMKSEAGSDDTDDQADPGDETEIHLDEIDEERDDKSVLEEPHAPDSDSDEKPAVVEPAPDDSDDDQADGLEDDPAVPDDKAPSGEDTQEPDSGEEGASDSGEVDGSESESMSAEDGSPSEENPRQETSEDGNENDFVALDDDEMDDGDDAESRTVDRADDGKQKQKNARKDRIDQKAAGEVKKTEALPGSKGQVAKGPKPPKDTTASKKIVMSAFIVLMAAGAAIYGKPDLFGLKHGSEETAPVKPRIEASVERPESQTPQQQSYGKNNRYRLKLDEASRLRDELLAKREEIYRLKLHYRNGIAELKDQIYREIQAADISSFEEALQNKRIELHLRTIQRRQVYIEELEKPDLWAHMGSEELLFLKRKTLIDLDMESVASGVDLDRHMRYLNSAIQKYQPSAEKLAVDPPPERQTSLETIWSQIRIQQSEHMQASVGEKNEKIIGEICSGDFTRVAQLTAITPKAAKCLARMDGSELFLNGLTRLTAKDAEYLFKWKGNWICLNGVKQLSPAVARYLFNWGGDWISLNGLTELPPELALYLTEWKGNQLELMGLDHEKSKPDERALKYLALWETMGGKLFISDHVRNEMKRVM